MENMSRRIRPVVLMLPILAMVAGCTMEDQQVAGTFAGGAIGAAVSPKNRTTGMVLGATAGLVAGTLMGQQQNGQCLYQRPDGSRYTAACP